jgi:thymidylate synthase ThyX
MTTFVPRSPLISATILKDSVSPEGVRLMTMELVYPRFIHSEFMTHRVLSKNAASSRAIPWKRMKQMLRDNPAVPASWRMHQSGMQGFEVASLETIEKAQAIWLAAMESAIGLADQMDALGLHKQVVNRMVEPWVHMKTVVTGVYWDNFLGLRDHKMADPTIDVLAKAVREAVNASTPTLLEEGEWHLPYISAEDLTTLGLENAKKVSAARCARTSYNNMSGKLSSLDEDIALHDRLLVDQPIHASPAEHQATPDRRNDSTGRWVHPDKHGNLHGWIQYRKTLAGENMDTVVQQ